MKRLLLFFLFFFFLPRQSLGLRGLGVECRKTSHLDAVWSVFTRSALNSEPKTKTDQTAQKNLTVTTAALSGRHQPGPVLIRTREKQLVLQVLWLPGIQKHLHYIVLTLKIPSPPIIICISSGSLIFPPLLRHNTYLDCIFCPLYLFGLWKVCLNSQ